MADRRLDRAARIAALPALALIVMVLVLPVTMLIGPGLAAPRAVPGQMVALAGTVAISAIAAALATIAALAVAAACRTAGRRTQDLVMTVSAIPLSLSALVTAFAFILLFGRSGTVTLTLAALGCDPRGMTALFYGPAGLVLVYLHMLAPRALTTLMPVVSGLDLACFHVARSLGAGRIRAARDALWPQVAPACLAAWTLCFAVSVGSYAAALVLLGTGAPLLSVLLVAQLGDGATDTAASGQIAAVLVALCGVAAWAAAVMGARHRVSMRGRPG
ncbi:ABC transporter permease subunit [Sphingomonas hankookensis]|uniref:ABC transporter permease n=1 Tax=Sphingomonas hengshuiensis TaxID=1609977 RepID=A0A2W4ZBS5_9SPHN|nr:MAG: ABC transporter permease [Sphingomonas hengshuiensis]